MNKKDTPIWSQTLFPSLSLFTSFGTLICCALPALLVTLGMGGSLASLIGLLPWITKISDYKFIIFIISGFFIFLGFILQWRTKYLPCPTDLKKAELCQNLRRVSWIMLYLSLTLFSLGFFYAFIATKFFY